MMPRSWAAASPRAIWAAIQRGDGDGAEEAMRALDMTPVKEPIRGGTGVDPFLEQGIPVANLGTGYFAPESEKELTSRQNVARHSLWLTHLVQVIADFIGNARGPRGGN